MNVELLRKIQQVIKAKPELFNMKHYDGFSECGTTHCIGGWAEAISGGRSFDDDKLPGQEALGISDDQATSLFLCPFWPRKFQGEEESWEPTIDQTIARIDHFIATEGWD